MKTKRRVFKFFISVVMALLVFSCEKDDFNSPTNEISEENKPQSFKELGLNHSYPTPVEALNYDVADLQALFLNSNNFKSASLEKAEYPSLEEMAKIVEENLAKYPDVYEMDSVDYLMVKANFPTLTDDEIIENLDLIDNYYTKNLQYDLILGIIEESLLKSSTKLKSGEGDYMGTGLYKREFWYLFYKTKSNCFS